jgi:carbon monoxide dehydrogenase subunit G
VKLLQGVVLGTFLAIVGAILALFALGLRPGANTLRSEVTISRPPGVVWRWVTEPGRLQRWVSWVSEAKQDSLTPDDVGSRQTWLLDDPNLRERIRVVGTVTEQDAPRLRRVHVRTPGMFTGEYTYALEAVAGGTHLTQSARFRYDVWIARLMEPLVTPQARRKLAGDQLRLKQLAESEATAPDSAAR